MSKTFKVAVLVLALFAMLGVTAVSTTPAHLHLNSSPNRCDLCFTAHVAAVQAPNVQPVHGLVLNGRAVVLAPYLSYHSIDSRLSSSRGPPSRSL
jgi:hypothetical protein